MGIAATSMKSFFLLFFLFICCELIGNQKVTSRDSSNKLSECRRCKVLTDSFNYWLDKTSRGKYEGGDAAWEEAKLNSYSRSEIRLVEIQEGLCSELKTHKDSCYALAEEAEQVLEKWWFNQDLSLADLYTWLCIENLQHCCPKSHFGSACTPCPKDKDNKICGGQGRCDGDGSRKGNGTCICKKGYRGTLCDECSSNFYSPKLGLCQRCHVACNGCSGEGADSCNACNSGWQLESGVCTDINECSTGVCKPYQYCTNSEGSYSCEDCHLSCKTCMGAGASNCLSCDRTHHLWFGSCIDFEWKLNLIGYAFKRLALYICLIIISLIIFRTSKSIASIVVVIVAVFIYLYEQNLKVSTLDVLLYLSNRTANTII